MWYRNKKFIIAIIVILLIIILIPFASIRPIYDKDELSYGVTFSQRYVEYMGLN